MLPLVTAIKMLFEDKINFYTRLRMLTGHELILATKRYASDQPLKSWWCIVSTTCLLAMSITGTLWNFHPVGKVVCSILSRLLTLRLFVIYHDQQHHAILPHSRLAEMFVRIFGIISLSPSSIWRSSHNHHHNHNSKLRGSHIGSFPIMTKEQFLKSDRLTRIKYLFMRHPLTIVFGYLTVFLQGMCIYPFFNDPKQHFDCLIAIIVHLTVAALLTYFFGWPALLLAQTIPALIACGIGTYLFYAQHNFTSVSFKDKSGWTYEKAALESSSYLKTNRLMAWFTGNIGY